MNLELPIKFVNKIQGEFFYSSKRNQWFNGGYGNGKSYGASLKALVLLCTFPYYRIGISRYSAKELSQSTMETFFKCCPQELYNEAYGGRRNDRDGYLRLVNGSDIFWMHLDDFAEEDLRGKEFNSVITDQAEEIAENIYITLDSRIERWDKVEIPSFLNPELFPKNPFSGKPMPPCYNMSLFNPDVISHWIYRHAHPESPQVEEFGGKLQDTMMYGEYSGVYNYERSSWFTASTHDNPAIPESLKRAMRSRDAAWVDRFYWGKWGISGGAIHYINEQSILGWERRENHPLLHKLLEVIQKDGIKYRVMDHGEGAPTCCLWFAWLSPSVIYSNYGVRSKGIHVCYREYYQPGKIIKYHREAIAALSKNERYYANFADPSIFRKNQQKYGGFWSTAEDYLDHTGWTEAEITKAPPIMWQPADNNEMATRDAVHELLSLDSNVTHPLGTEGDSPALYFIKKHAVEYPSGCNFVIQQTMAARRKKIGTENGEDIYSDERDPNVTDHAYDPLRYYAIMPKIMELPARPRDTPQFSFNRHLMNRRKFRIHEGRIYGN